MNKRIVIIGAGAAGIAAASKLWANGFHNLLILEAESRIGGRVHTIPFADNVLDMGAQWCHGAKNNVVFGMAERHALLEVSVEQFNMIRSDGSWIPQRTRDDLMELAMRLLHGNVDEMERYQGSLGSYIIQR